MTSKENLDFGDIKISYEKNVPQNELKRKTKQVFQVGKCFRGSILSYLILSYSILSYPILSYPILSYPILSYPILSYQYGSTPTILSVHRPYILFDLYLYSAYAAHYVYSYLILSYPILSYFSNIVYIVLVRSGQWYSRKKT